MFSGVFSGGGGGTGDPLRTTGASPDNDIGLARVCCVDADAALGGGMTAFRGAANGDFRAINRLNSYLARMNFSSSLSLSVPIRFAGGGCRTSSGQYS